MAQYFVQEMLKEMQDEKKLWMEGQEKKIFMNCSFMNCPYEAGSISEAFKHYENEHNLQATATSSFFIDNNKVFFVDTPPQQCNVIEIATMKNPWNCQEKFSQFIEAHFIKTNCNNKNYEDLVPQLKVSPHWVYIHCRKCKILLKNEETLIAHLGNEHDFFFDVAGLHIKKTILITGQNIEIGDYVHDSQEYFERYVRLSHFDKFEKIEIDFNMYTGYNTYVDTDLFEVPLEDQEI